MVGRFALVAAVSALAFAQAEAHGRQFAGCGNRFASQMANAALKVEVERIVFDPHDRGQEFIGAPAFTKGERDRTVILPNRMNLYGAVQPDPNVLSTPGWLKETLAPSPQDFGCGVKALGAE